MRKKESERVGSDEKRRSEKGRNRAIKTVHPSLRPSPFSALSPPRPLSRFTVPALPGPFSFAMTSTGVSLFRRFKNLPRIHDSVRVERHLDRPQHVEIIF